MFPRLYIGGDESPQSNPQFYYTLVILCAMSLPVIILIVLN